MTSEHSVELEPTASPTPTKQANSDIGNVIENTILFVVM
jgi:hypothetical protein